MSIPYVHSLTETRFHIGSLLNGMVAGTTGPLIFGSHGTPVGTVLPFALFDELRDRLAELEAGQHAPVVEERVQHPAGTTTRSLDVLLAGAGAGEVTFWPDLVADVKHTSATPALVDALRTVAGGHLAGASVPGLDEAWRWFLVVDQEPARPAQGWHLIWRQHADAVELVAVLPISTLLARSWQAGPDPEQSATSE